MDIVDSETRSRMMSNIRSRDTKPEVIIRKGLFSRGFRYSLHSKKLPGKPDIVLPKYNAVIFIHGCFWHMHNCPLFVIPKTRTEYWIKKLEDNKKRDIKNIQNLSESGLRIAIIWECVIKKKTPDELKELIDDIGFWLENPMLKYLEIPNVKRGRD